MTNNSVHIFIADYLVQSLANHESTYSFLSALGISHKTIYNRLWSKDTSELSAFIEELFHAIEHNIKKNIKVTHGGKRYEVTNVSFHQKFGWVLESEIGKAYLGKLSIPYDLKMTIGLMSYFSGSSTVVGNELTVGSFCSIADGTHIITENTCHPTIYPSTYNFCGNRRIVSENMQFEINYAQSCKKNNEVIIGNDVWIGRDVTIMNGVTLGDGCVIGMKALVTHDCKPFGIYGGVPAKLIRYRFPENVVDELLEIKWWQWPYEKIRKNKEFFNTDLSTQSCCFFETDQH